MLHRRAIKKKKKEKKDKNLYVKSVCRSQTIERVLVVHIRILWQSDSNVGIADQTRMKLVKRENKVLSGSFTPSTYTQAAICMLLCGAKFTTSAYTCHRRKSFLFFLRTARSRGYPNG